MKIKKNIGIFLIIFTFLFIGFELNTNIFASLGNGFNEDLYYDVAQENDTSVDGLVSKIGSTILLILQVSAICGVVFTGVKYMYADSNDKGKIKETLIWIIVGAIFFFFSPSLINFITDMSNNVIK